jgi:hypothetical protein
MMRALTVGICVLTLSGCGGGDSSDSASAPSGMTQIATTQQTHQGSSRERMGEKAKNKETKSSAVQGPDGQSTATVRVPPISSAPIAGSEAPAPGVKTVKGGDDSVQSYGVEADEKARTEAAIALQAYLNARLEEDWESVCSYFAQRAREELATLTRQLQSQGKDVSDCAATMAILGEGASQQPQDPTITEVLSFRGEGDVPGNPFYMIFTGPPGSTLYSMPMYFEGGDWKIGLALPSELPV